MGQPISIGSREWNWGSISLDEVSIVRQGAVKGYAPPAVIGVDAFEPADVDRAVVVDPNRDPAWVPSLGLERRLVKRCARRRALDRRHMHRHANRNQLREVGPAAVAHRSALNRSRRSFASSSRAARRASRAARLSASSSRLAGSARSSKNSVPRRVEIERRAVTRVGRVRVWIETEGLACPGVLNPPRPKLKGAARNLGLAARDDLPGPGFAELPLPIVLACRDLSGEDRHGLGSSGLWAGLSQSSGAFRGMRYIPGGLCGSPQGRHVGVLCESWLGGSP